MNDFTNKCYIFKKCVIFLYTEVWFTDKNSKPQKKYK